MSGFTQPLKLFLMVDIKQKPVLVIVENTTSAAALITALNTSITASQAVSGYQPNSITNPVFTTYTASSNFTWAASYTYQVAA